MSALEHFAEHEAVVAAIEAGESSSLRRAARLAGHAAEGNAGAWVSVGEDLGRCMDLLEPSQDAERRVLRHARRKARELARTAESLHRDMVRLLELSDSTSAESE